MRRRLGRTWPAFFRKIGEGRFLLAVGGDGKFELEGVQPLLGVAVVAGDEAAFEAPVHHQAVALVIAERLGEPVAQAQVAGAARRRAQVEVRQCPVEETRRLGDDRVAVEQDRLAVFLRDIGEFPFEPLVIGQPVGRQARLHFLVGRRLAVLVKGGAREIRLRHKPGGDLAGVERRVVGRPVEIDHVAGPDRLEHRNAEFGGEVVKPVEMPVGVRPGEAAVGHARLDPGRDRGAHMGNAHEQRRIAGHEAVVAHLVSRPFAASAGSARGGARSRWRCRNPHRHGA